MKVLITGGSRGIGAACVRRFAKQGDDVVFFYRSSDAAAERLVCECGAKAIRVDVSDPDAVQEAVARAAAELGGIDVLVNNAGIAQIKLLSDITDADWQRMLGTNLSGAFYLCREVSRYMIGQQYGRIVNVGSMWGKVGASCEVHYSAAKAGWRGMRARFLQAGGPRGFPLPQCA